MANYILLVGVQGSGKGTQAKLIVEKYGLLHLSTGDLFRTWNTPVAQQAREIVNAGNLVPDSITLQMVKERLQEPDAANGVLFDGFPRTVPQAEGLDELLKGFGGKVDAVLMLNLDREVAMERINKRFAEQQRADDTPEKAQKRMNDFYNVTLPTFNNYYRPKGLVIDVDGDQSVEAVSAEITAALKQKLGK
ncbi:MAG: adenylate kinase [Anaerolineae bacterium]|nr:adenylate kinase [Anaerolineae bacterium]